MQPLPSLRSLRGDVHVEAGQHRVLHVPRDGVAVLVLLSPRGLVGECALVQLLGAVERDHVGVAEIGELTLVIPVEPHRMSGIVGLRRRGSLLQTARLAVPTERQRAQGKQEQDADRCPTSTAPDGPVRSQRTADHATRISDDDVGPAGNHPRVVDPGIVGQGNRTGDPAHDLTVGHHPAGDHPVRNRSLLWLRRRGVVEVLSRRRATVSRPAAQG